MGNITPGEQKTQMTMMLLKQLTIETPMYHIEPLEEIIVEQTAYLYQIREIS